LTSVQAASFTSNSAFNAAIPMLASKVLDEPSHPASSRPLCSRRCPARETDGPSSQVSPRSVEARPQLGGSVFNTTAVQKAPTNTWPTDASARRLLNSISMVRTFALLHVTMIDLQKVIDPFPAFLKVLCP
jgi:hypothetical protein